MWVGRAHECSKRRTPGSVLAGTGKRDPFTPFGEVVVKMTTFASCSGPFAIGFELMTTFASCSGPFAIGFALIMKR